MPKKTKKPAARLASERRKIERARIINPLAKEVNLVDRVERVVDTLTAMRKRRHITERELLAGERYRAAFEMIEGQAGGAMDFERARGGSLPGQPPSPARLVAGETLAAVRQKLYTRDHAVIQAVCGHGLTVEACAHLFGTGRSGREEAGRALRRGLRELADMWWPAPRPAGIRSFVSEKPRAGDVGIIEVGGTYVAA